MGSVACDNCQPAWSLIGHTPEVPYSNDLNVGARVWRTSFVAHERKGRSVATKPSLWIRGNWNRRRKKVSCVFGGEGG